MEYLNDILEDNPDAAAEIYAKKARRMQEEFESSSDLTSRIVERVDLPEELRCEMSRKLILRVDKREFKNKVNPLHHIMPDPDLGEQLSTIANQRKRKADAEMVEALTRRRDLHVKKTKVLAEREEEIVSDLKRIKEKLEDPSSSHSETQSDLQLERQIKELQARTSEMMRVLSYLVEAFFPPPPLRSKERKRKTPLPSMDEPAQVGKYSPLTVVLKDTMTAAISSHKFIDIKPTYWPPHVNLLRRAGIIEYNGQGTKIRLVPFHIDAPPPAFLAKL